MENCVRLLPAKVPDSLSYIEKRRKKWRSRVPLRHGPIRLFSTQRCLSFVSACKLIEGNDNRRIKMSRSTEHKDKTYVASSGSWNNFRAQGIWLYCCSRLMVHARHAKETIKEITNHRLLLKIATISVGRRESHLEPSRTYPSLPTVP